MKKALTITLSGVIFTIEEDAYDKLNAYLEDTRAYFANYNDGEIMKDIEARMAEQLMYKKDSVIAVEDVDKLIATMGKVEDFKSESGGNENAGDASAGKGRQGGKRKLYRNPDDVVLAGVASGLAAYFGIDPLIMRLIFIVLSLGGSGIGGIAYIILAFVVPKAETPAEKLQMYGGPVSLDSFKRNLNEHAENLRKNGKDLFVSRGSGLRSALERLIALIGRLIRLAGRLILALIAIAGIALIASATFGLVNLIFNSGSPYIRFPVTPAIGLGAYYAVLAVSYAVAVIPLMFIIGAVLSLARKKFIVKGPVLFGFAGLWVVALIVLGTLAVRFLPQIQAQVDTMRQEHLLPPSAPLAPATPF